MPSYSLRSRACGYGESPEVSWWKTPERNFPPDLDALKKGIGNLEKHVENMKLFGIHPIVAINRFTSDSEEELEYIREVCKRLNVEAAIVDVWGKGGEGALNLASIVEHVATMCPNHHNTLYDWNWTPEQKIETIAKKNLWTNAVDYTAQAKIRHGKGLFSRAGQATCLRCQNPEITFR